MNNFASPTVVEEKLGELDCLRVRTPFSEALIARQGGHLMRFQHHGQQPLVWLSDTTALEHGQAIRGGVPVCWPWFGDLTRSPESVRNTYVGTEPPFHGMVRTLDWQMQDPVIENNEVQLTFQLLLPQGLPNWPHPSELRLRLTIGQHLDMNLQTRNLGTTQLALTQALHTYFAVSDSREVSLRGFDGCTYLDAMDNWREKHQDGDIRFTEETDRIYLGVGPTLSIDDPGWERRIHLHTRQSRSAIVWNPWINKAQRMPNFPDDAWQRMLCIETARMGEADVLLIPPGAAHDMGVEIRVENN
ncbi:D-hexose-6-phosphate mutarotase [Pigmentiphaga aceris]|uniref:Putative glucose-6-phosphate 1-epimerase n=1 Tax=Pigmentiphaga aceris TaxID=1940612 RepID=A0A5C0B415_9BURK|nr:D-hexose-6-phosphate mutarotase [Pigmentiphaga aceris]QEI07990.1 D-hexose-6-phosphate mutarotase [Pigmentiphaga aceris]